MDIQRGRKYNQPIGMSNPFQHADPETIRYITELQQNIMFLNAKIDSLNIQPQVEVDEFAPTDEIEVKGGDGITVNKSGKTYYVSKDYEEEEEDTPEPFTVYRGTVGAADSIIVAPGGIMCPSNYITTPFYDLADYGTGVYSKPISDFPSDGSYYVRMPYAISTTSAYPTSMQFVPVGSLGVPSTSSTIYYNWIDLAIAVVSDSKATVELLQLQRGGVVLEPWKYPVFGLVNSYVGPGYSCYPYFLYPATPSTGSVNAVLQEGASGDVALSGEFVQLRFRRDCTWAIEVPKWSL